MNRANPESLKQSAFFKVEFTTPRDLKYSCVILLIVLYLESIHKYTSTLWNSTSLQLLGVGLDLLMYKWYAIIVKTVRMKCE